MATKPSIPKGTRDFSPTEMVRRNYILNTIKTVYQRFGFQQIETPTMENLSTLEGKYGDEGDKLLFRVLNSGTLIEDFPINKATIADFVEGKMKLYSSANFPAIELIRPRELQKHVAEKGLRYDLTVPFARYVVVHQNEITFPFKRFQIQPVWRADRPQKGRYREFVQCDADVIGSDSLLNEVEMIQMIDEVFSKLGIKVVIKINNRKILAGIVEFLEIERSKSFEFIGVLDKIEKIGADAATLEFLKMGISLEKIEKIKHDLLPTELEIDIVHNDLRIENLKSLFNECKSEIGLKGVEEIEYLNSFFIGKEGEWPLLNRSNYLQLDTSLARGLNYYTGTIFEVKINDPRSTFTSSVLGGGRYDDLTGIFGLPNVSGVGISFGVDRIYDVMEEMKLFDQLNLQSSTTQLMFVNFGKEEEKYCLKLLQQVRTAGINAEIYPDVTKKIGKQFSYADAKKIPFVISIGQSEKEKQVFKIKNMSLQKENEFSLIEFENIIHKIKNKEEIF